jgi:hypothetical protein
VTRNGAIPSHLVCTLLLTYHVPSLLRAYSIVWYEWDLGGGRVTVRAADTTWAWSAGCFSMYFSIERVLLGRDISWNFRASSCAVVNPYLGSSKSGVT